MHVFGELLGVGAAALQLAAAALGARLAWKGYRRRRREGDEGASP